MVYHFGFQSQQKEVYQSWSEINILRELHRKNELLIFIPNTNLVFWFGILMAHLVAVYSVIMKYVLYKYILYYGIYHVSVAFHRDLKPSNIFIQQDDNIAIGDFGVATVMADVLTRTRSAVGEENKIIFFGHNWVY